MPDPGLSNPVPPNLSTITAPLLLGILFNFAMYGLLVAQIYVYTTSFPFDKTRIKALVYSVFVLETLQTAMSGADAYYWFISGFGDLSHLSNPYLSPLDTPMMVSIISMIIQLFFCYRIFTLNRKIWWLTVLIAVISIVQAVGSFVGSISAMIAGNFDEAKKTTRFTIVWLTGEALADILISAVMICLLLRARKQEHKVSSQILTRLVRLTVETNTLTAGFAVISLALAVGLPNANYFTTPTMVIGKLYSNTLLVTFNHRISLRRPLVRTRGSSEATDNTMNVRIENTIASNAARAGSTIPNPHTVSMYAAQEHSGEPYKADTFHDDLRESEDDTVLDINSSHTGIELPTRPSRILFHDV